MNIDFTEHALNQLRERNLSERIVRETLGEPDRLVRQSKNRYLAIKVLPKAVRQYLLVVAYDRRDDKIEVVTTFITSKVNKYL